jgi:hypothetical protein
LELLGRKYMGRKDTNRVCGFRVCAALIDELVHNTLGADVDEIYEERGQRGIVVHRTLHRLSLIDHKVADVDWGTGDSTFQRLF